MLLLLLCVLAHNRKKGIREREREEDAQQFPFFL